MKEIISKYDFLGRVEGKSHNTYLTLDIEKKRQFFCDKSIDTLIFVNSNNFKEKLLKTFGDIEVEVFTLNERKKVKLSNDIENGSLIYINGKSVEKRARYDFQDLIEIMCRLRAEDGCEWDKAQTHESIRINLIEEAYELVEGIDKRNKDMMLEEAGDVLLQAVFHTHIAMDDGDFDYSDMLYELCNKLITRHTHIFGENHANNAIEALNFWQAAKKKEKKYTSFADAMDRVPKNMPSLMYAYKIQKYAKKCGFDFNDIDGAMDKIKEEVKEVIEAKDSNKEMEGGDVLFSVVNFLRLLHIEPELALKASTEKFMKRFKEMEDILTKDGRELDSYTLDEMDKVWDKIKK